MSSTPLSSASLTAKKSQANVGQMYKQEVVKKKKSWVQTAWGIAGLVILILGIIVTTVSIILLFVIKPVPWYTWVLLALGVLHLIVGFILIIVAVMKNRPKPKNTAYEEQKFKVTY